MPHYCAFGCKNPDVVMHVFPNPAKFPERFKAWVSLVGGKLDTLSDLEIYKNKRICDIHFPDEHRNRYKRLNALAVPSLHLPETTVTQQSTTTNDSQPVVAAELAPASSFVTPVIRHSKTTSDSQPVPAELPGPATYGIIHGAAAVVMEHNYSVLSKTRRNSSLVKDVSVRTSQCMQLRPLRTTIKYLQTELRRMRKKGVSFKERLANAEKLCSKVAFQRVTKNMTKPAQLFVHMQQQSRKKPKGRRFSIEEKILSLSLFKKSPKAYRLLYKYFALPSSKAMKRLLSQIKLSPGINPIIFEKIKKTMAQRDTADRLCSLIFDEMSITPQVFYNSQKDTLQGFSSNQKNSFADHVLVFMVKGIKRSFKQPIAYYFTNSLTKLQLKKIIKTVIEHALQSGLIIVSTVCDQSSVNVSTMTELVNETKATYLRREKEWRHDVINIKGHDIIPLFDVPHLIKGLRNNLLSKDMAYTTADVEKIVKWDYYQMVYAADKSYGELRLLHKITEEHVNPDKIKKMRVKLATQLFSHSVAVVTEHLTGRGDLPEVCRQLIDITLLLDNIFDSLNGSSLSIPNGKIYKGPVKRNSPHHHLWQRAKVVLKTIKYIKKIEVGDKIRFAETIVPSVTNLIKTIEGIESVWKVLSSKYGLDAMLTRNFNQDPVENFFGNIRSYGSRNIAPNTVAFEGAFKALLLNNYTSPHSRGANCEEDSNECLQTLDFFLRENIVTTDVPEESEINFNTDICFSQPPVDPGQSNYVCGWVLKKCLTNIVKHCQHCRQTLLDNTSNDKNNAFIKSKEYQNKKWLCYPSKELDCFFKQVQDITSSFLRNNSHKKGVKHTVMSFTDMLTDDPFSCLTHKDALKKYFMNTIINVIIYSWCRSVNRILTGKLTYVGDDDDTKIAAQKYFNKHRNYKNRK